MGNFVDRVSNTSGVVKMIERVLGGTETDGENRLIGTYEDFVLQADVSKESSLVIIRLGKALPDTVSVGQVVALNKYNAGSVLGTHLIYNLRKNTQFYTYKAPCWVDEQFSETEFVDFLKLCSEEAQECFDDLLEKRG